MDDYISREAVINITAETGAWETQNRIRELPSADVIPVKHGRWLANGTVYTCSECNSSVPKSIFVIDCDFEGCPLLFCENGQVTANE